MSLWTTASLNPVPGRGRVRRLVRFDPPERSAWMTQRRHLHCQARGNPTI